MLVITLIIRAKKYGITAEAINSKEDKNTRHNM